MNEDKLAATLISSLDGMKQEMRELRTDVKDSSHEISRAVQRLVSLQEKQMALEHRVVKTEDRIDKHDSRLDTIEKEAPSWNQTKKWVFGFITLAATAVVALLFKFIGLPHIF